jgi:hypothetical protein
LRGARSCFHLALFRQSAASWHGGFVSPRRDAIAARASRPLCGRKGGRDAHAPGWWLCSAVPPKPWTGRNRCGHLRKLRIRNWVCFAISPSHAPTKSCSDQVMLQDASADHTHPIGISYKIMPIESSWNSWNSFLKPDLQSGRTRGFASRSRAAELRPPGHVRRPPMCGRTPAYRTPGRLQLPRVGPWVSRNITATGAPQRAAFTAGGQWRVLWARERPQQMHKFSGATTKSCLAKRPSDFTPDVIGFGGAGRRGSRYGRHKQKCGEDNEMDDALQHCRAPSPERQRAD